MKLIQAARTNDVVQIKRYKGIEDINQRDNRGATPLILATYYNNNEAVLALLEAGAGKELKDHNGNTALMVACYKGYTKVARLLIEHGAQVKAANRNNATALTYAATIGQEELIRPLLIYGADPMQKDNRGMNAIDHALAQQNPQNCMLMLAAANNYLL